MRISLLVFSLLAAPISILGADPGDYYDLSFFTKAAAIGDSYAAGIGAGNRLNYFCSRYDGSYAALVAKQLGVDPHKFAFTYTACSGATIADVSKQAQALSLGQQFVIMSAGGMDIGLVGLLNSCVYSFWALVHHPNCDQVLYDSRAYADGPAFASALDGLIATVKSKLEVGGNIYYVGYARFWDTADHACDRVSWHFWWSLFTREYLTMARRRKMNGLVTAVNTAIGAAVARAGPQVHFIGYDKYVEMTNGRYCQPGQDEDNAKGANLRNLFFYQIRSKDTKWFDASDWPFSVQRRSTENDGHQEVSPANGTLDSLYGALIQEAIQKSAVAAVDDGNAGSDVEIFIDTAEHNSHRRRSDDLSIYRNFSIDNTSRPSAIIQSSSPYKGTVSWKWSPPHYTTQPVDQTRYILGTKMTNSAAVAAVAFNRTGPYSNYTAAKNESSTGTIIANATHVLLKNGDVVRKDSLGSWFHVNDTDQTLTKGEAVQKSSSPLLFVPDSLSRTFHPTQAGHVLISRLILFNMRLQRANALGINAYLTEQEQSTGQKGPLLLKSACLSSDTSDTWASHEAVVAAAAHFCAEVYNLRGQLGATTSSIFNKDTFDYMNALDATLTIEPLVVRKIWSKGKATNPNCNQVNTNYYLDHTTMKANAQDFCSKSAAQSGSLAKSGTTFSWIYNDGTPSRVFLSTTWPEGPRDYQIFQEECEYYMGLLSDQCNPQDETNLLGWRHGGEISDKNGVKYSIKPTQKRPSPPSTPQGSCVAKWKVLFYSFDIYGGGFASSDYGRSNGALFDQLKGCGALTSWRFDYYSSPAEDGTEWHASGNLPIIMSSHCIAKAVRSAGGFPSNC